jgi:hypothetical protein
MADLAYGFLTLATHKDYLKAIGLALSLRVSNPGVPIAVACSPSVAVLLRPHFDHVIEENPSLRGFEHKVHLDKYTPFRETVFFDSDVLVFKEVRPYLTDWGPRAYTACGSKLRDGISSFGLDRQAVLAKLGKAELVVIDGAGHAAFRMPEAGPVFDLARQITARYSDYAGDAIYADEDAMNIAMTLLDLEPAPYGDFFARHLSARPASLRMDPSRGLCEFIAADTGKPFAPCMVHFANNEAPIPYARYLTRLFRRFSVPTKGVWRQAVSDLYTSEVRDRASRHLGWLKSLALG